MKIVFLGCSDSLILSAVLRYIFHTHLVNRSIKCKGCESMYLIHNMVIRLIKFMLIGFARLLELSISSDIQHGVELVTSGRNKSRIYVGEIFLSVPELCSHT